jgi:uncharacterized protein
VLELALTPRLTTAHHRVDALRGAVAVEREPIVCRAEQADLDGSLGVDDIAVGARADHRPVWLPRTPR